MMAAPKASLLADRAVLRLSGRDRTTFLQGLVTADILGLAAGAARWVALLTPQGKILFDFLVVEQGDDILLDCARAQLEELMKRLAFYKLRAQVSIEPVPGMAVAAALPDCQIAVPSAIVFADPRLTDLGSRALISDDHLSALNADASDYRARRIALGIPDTVEDIGSGVLFPHEANLDQLGGVSFTKGCYVGQEVVSRMEHRGTARNRILPIAADRPLIKGSDITGRGRAFGQVLSCEGTRALALIRLDRLAEALDAGDPIIADDAAVTVLQPAWARFKVPGAAAA
jgi:tRNA-modifying protein YgfZ